MRAFRSSSCSPGVDGAGKSESVNLLNEWMDRGGLSLARLVIRPRRIAAGRSTALLAGASAAGPRRSVSQIVVFAPAGWIAFIVVSARWSSTNG